MAYSPPVGSAVDFVFTGRAYSAPVGSAVNFDFLSVSTLQGSGVYTLGGSSSITYGTSISAAGAVAVYGAAALIVLPALVIRDKYWLGGGAEFGFPYRLVGSGGYALKGSASLRSAASLLGSGALSLKGSANILVPSVLNAFGPLPLFSGAAFQSFAVPTVSGAGKFAPLSGSASFIAAMNLIGKGSLGLRGSSKINKGASLHVASRYSLGGLASVATGAKITVSGKVPQLAGDCLLRHGVRFNLTGSVLRLMGEAEVTHNRVFPIFGSGCYGLFGAALFSFPTVAFDETQFITTHKQRIEVFTDV